MAECFFFFICHSMIVLSLHYRGIGRTMFAVPTQRQCRQWATNTNINIYIIAQSYGLFDICRAWWLHSRQFSNRWSLCDGFLLFFGSEQISEIEFSWYDKRELWNEPFEIFKIWQDAPCWRKQKKGGCGKYQYKLNCNKCYPYNTKNSFHFFHIQIWKLRACKFQSMVNPRNNLQQHNCCEDNFSLRILLIFTGLYLTYWHGFVASAR